MKKKFPNEAEFIVADGIPISEYLKIIERVNVVVDQSLSYSYGMNALISMAKGKIVMSGAEPEILPIYNVKKHPVINIKPNIDQICSQIENIIKNMNNIPRMGYESRVFVENVHSNKLIAYKFLKIWNEFSK